MKKKLLALFLCCALSFGLVTAALITPASADSELMIYSDNVAVDAVSVPKNEKKTLAAGGLSGYYQWQIQVGGDVWANIAGATGAELEVGYALVANLLYGGTANIRCRVTGAAEEPVYSNTVAVQITDETPVSAPAQTPKAPTVISEAEPVGEPVIIPPQTVEETPAPDAAPAADAAPANYLMANVAPFTLSDPAPVNDPAPSNDGEDEDDDRVLPSTFNITISYVYGKGEAEEGQEAAPMWSATAPAGSTFIQTVTSPVILGYNADHPTVDINDVVDKDIAYTVIYTAANVGFKVNHNWQNADDDNYTLHETEEKEGLTGRPVGDHLEKTYDGFISLLYETSSEVLADGSTVVDINYDREYFLMNFNLDGGYGVEPIYARYGAAIGDIGTPKKTGYTFAGWTQDGKTKVDPAKTMPFKGTSYKAMWTIGDSAKVTIVVWGENADDEGYSYYKNAEIMAKPGEKLTLDDLRGKLICGKEEHTHSAACGLNCQHVHNLACYNLSTTLTSTNPNDQTARWCNSKPETYFEQLGLEDGYLYYDDENAMLDSRDNYYLRYNGQYFKLTQNQFNRLKGDQVGTANDGTSNYTDYYYKYTIKASAIRCQHAHTDDCYICGKTEHAHTSACYYNTSFMDDPDLWDLVYSDEITVAADGTSIVNVKYDRVEFTLHFRNARSDSDDYGIIKAKWGSYIRDDFNAKGKSAGTYNWSENRDAGQPWTSYLDIMPTKEMWFYANKKNSGTETAYYYIEGLDGKDVLFYTSTANGNRLRISEEEFIKIEGFTFDSSRSSKVNDYFNGAKFYYTRNSYKLEFYNYNATIDDKTATVKYEAPLSGYGFTPDYPSGLEPNAYVFDGWYTTAGCYEGSEADLNTMTMPASNVILYAKWTPKAHTVKTYLTDADMTGDPMQTWTVSHGKSVDNPPEDPTNGKYEFVGWFYIDDNGDEKAFNFSMPVNRDLNLYAKWRSNTPVNYNVRYVLEGTETDIAPATTGSALAGSTKNFVAKTGDLLNEGYKEHYFPKVPVYPMKLEIDEINEYKFEYVNLESVKYTVRYLDKKTGEPVVGTDDVVANDETRTSSKAIVTEPYKRVKGYMPDAYQKQLVLSADEEQNVLIFWYVEDPYHAPVQVTHWVQNVDGKGYTIYQTSTDLNAQIGEEYPATQLDIPGFAYNANPTSPVDGNPPLASGVLTEDGLSLNLYYDRILYPYEFRFLEYGTEDNELATAVKDDARYQAQVTQSALTIPGYTLVSAESQTINIAIEEPADVANKNVKKFYYTEQTVDIKYVVVSPDGTTAGTLSSYQDNVVKVITGSVNGSTPAAASGFKFVGWYKDEACTEAVDASWIDANNKLTPDKTKNYGTAESHVMGYEAATYYAKFEYDVANLTINKTGCQNIDENQSFIFDVTGPNDYSKRVVIKGTGSVTITGLKVGTYTVTEVKSWSWRYSPESPSVTHEINPTQPYTFDFTNNREQGKWLGGDAYSRNIFGTLDTVSGN